jgi:molybdopterin converting factor small subunit
MDVRVLFFARSRELAGTSEATVTLQPGSTTTTLMKQLLQQVTEGCPLRRWCRACRLLRTPIAHF